MLTNACSINFTQPIKMACSSISPLTRNWGLTPTPLRRQAIFGWTSPHLAVRGNGRYALGLNRLATPVGRQPIQRHGVLLESYWITLGRPVKLVGKEDNTACIAAVKRGYSPALRYLQRLAQVSLGFCHEVFHPNWEDEVAPKYLSELTYWESSLTRETG